MPTCKKPKFRFDTASAISQGARDYQEDALICDFSGGSDLNFVVLADGMGGHAAGEVASKIVVTEVFSELTFMRPDMIASAACIVDALNRAAVQANEMLKAHVDQHPENKGMGATLVSTVIVGGKLYWISIGDSPLYLFRDNKLTQLNEDHSMGKTIDMMVRSGVLSPEVGENHPDRNVLTSVLFGEPVPEIDCPKEPMSLQAGDTLIVASDGVQFLENAEIETLLKDRPFSRSSEIAEVLMEALEGLRDPDLDNVSLSVVQVRSPERAIAIPHRAPRKVKAQVAKPSLFQKVLRPPSKVVETTRAARD